jgi:GT2 family glycosyltransferase
MISLLLVTKNKYQVLNNNLNEYIRYSNLDNIFIFDNSSLDEKKSGIVLSHDKIHVFNDSNYKNIGLYGGLSFLINIAKKCDSKYFVILDDDAYMPEESFSHILDHEIQLNTDVGVSLHLSDITKSTFTEPVYFKNLLGTNFLFSLDDFYNSSQPVFVDSAPNIGIVVSNRLMKLVKPPSADLFFCGEAFFFDNFRDVGARLFYMKDFKVYHKPHTFIMVNLFFSNRRIKVSLVSDFHDYYEIRNYLRYLSYKRNYKSIFLLPLLISVKIYYSTNKISKIVTIVKSLFNFNYSNK